MAGILDKIKAMFGGAKSKAGDGAGTSKMDVVKEKAGDIKDKVDEMVDKVGEKVPDKVKDAYEKVSDKVESVIPGDRDRDGDEGATAEVPAPH